VRRFLIGLGAAACSGCLLSSLALAQPGPIPGGYAHPDNAYLSPPPMTGEDAATLRLTTTDGRTLEGKIVGGALTIQTVFGTRDIEAVHLKVLSGQMLALDDGFTHNGSVTVLDGTLQFETMEGIQTIPAAKLSTIRDGLTFGNLEPSRSAANSEPSETSSEVRGLLLGKWVDSQNTSWEFFRDGTLLMRQQLSGHFLVDRNRLKVDIWMFGIKMAQVYDIVDASHDQVVLRQKSSQLVLHRTP